MAIKKYIPQFLSKLPERITDLVKTLSQTPLLTLLTIISLIINIVQYQTKNDVAYQLESIIISSKSTVAKNEKEKMSNDDLIHQMEQIRILSVAGLRLLGYNQTYDIKDSISMDRPVHDFLQDIYRILLEIRIKAPNLWYGRTS